MNKLSNDNTDNQTERLGLAQRHLETLLSAGTDANPIIKAAVKASSDFRLSFRSFEILEAWALNTYRLN